MLGENEHAVVENTKLLTCLMRATVKSKGRIPKYASEQIESARGWDCVHLTVGQLFGKARRRREYG